MSTYIQILYHIVFSTKNRERSLTTDSRQKLYKYICGIIENKKCHLYRINGVEDHLHILSDLHPTVSLSSLIKDIKLATTDFIKKNNVFRYFNGWQEGYGAFTYSFKEKDRLIEYIKNQEEHHRKISFKEEYQKFLDEHNVDYNDKYII